MSKVQPASEWKYQCLLLEAVQHEEEVETDGEEVEDPDAIEIESREMNYMHEATISMPDEEGDPFWRSRPVKMDLVEIIADYWALPTLPIEGQYHSCTNTKD